MPNYSKSKFEPGTTTFKGSGVMSRSRKYGPTGKYNDSPKSYKVLCSNCGHPFGMHYGAAVATCPRLVKPTKKQNNHV